MVPEDVPKPDPGRCDHCGARGVWKHGLEDPFLLPMDHQVSFRRHFAEYDGIAGLHPMSLRNLPGQRNAKFHSNAEDETEAVNTNFHTSTMPTRPIPKFPATLPENQDHLPNPEPTPTEPDGPAEEDLCVVCLVHEPRWVFEACRHRCVCEPCAKLLRNSVGATGSSTAQKRGRKKHLRKVPCPLCRTASKIQPGKNDGAP
jgi:hypothetical protein